MVKQRRLYWTFYKSTIALNFGFSFMFALIAPTISGIYLPTTVLAYHFPAAFCQVFAISVLTAGPLVTFIYKELARPLEYYYYYNQGISKTGLIICCILANIPAAALALIIKHHVAST